MDGLLGRINTFFDGISAWTASLPARPTNRVFGLGVGLPAATVLGIAAWLTPSPKGFGTHMQLGLGGCTMLTLTGWPCPMCGMTTTFSLMAHFRLVDAFFNQPFGVVLFSLTVVLAALGLADAVSGAGFLRRALNLVQRREQIYAIGLLTGMIGGWLYKCTLLHPEVLHFFS